MKTRNTTSSGLGVMGVLQIIFIVLKLCKVITWKWWIVFIPLEIQLVISLIIIAIYLFLILKK